jgi:hypothetical protein
MAPAEQVLKVAKAFLKECLRVTDGSYSANDGKMGTAFYKLTEVVMHLITNQEWITSTMADSRKLADKVSKEQDNVQNEQCDELHRSHSQPRYGPAGKKGSEEPP